MADKVNSIVSYFVVDEAGEVVERSFNVSTPEGVREVQQANLAFTHPQVRFIRKLIAQAVAEALEQAGYSE